MTLLLTACGGIKPYKMPITQGVVVTAEMAEQLQEGLHKQQVRGLLGPDYAKNIFDQSVWQYIYRTTDKTMHPDAMSRINLKFDQDGYLESWQIIDG